MFEETFGYTWQVAQTILIDYYGWVVFAWAMVYMGYQLWLERQQTKFYSTIKWVFLEARVDELNEKSPVAMEQIFASMHAMMQNFSMGEKWTGRIALHMSAEIVSIGGRVSYMFKLPERYRNLLESAIFAQYPKAEIREIQDYLANLPRDYEPQTAEFEMWGTQFIKRTNNALPIRTFRQFDQFFEHPEQKTTVDSLAGVLEALSNIMPHELMAIQVVLKPVNDDWKKAAYDHVQTMKGLPPKAKPPGLFENVFIHAPGAAVGALIDGIGLAGEPAEKKKEEKPQALTPSMTDSEKHNIDSVVSGLSKLSYEVKMRLLYLAPKDKFSKGMRVPEIMGAFRNFDNPQLNGLRPDIRMTTDASFKLFQGLEQPWLDYKILIRKNKFLKWFKDRSHWGGSGKTIMNTEELATLLHFPQAPNARVSQIERVNTVKSAPPIDLPVG
jgi:hypothetical protein